MLVNIYNKKGIMIGIDLHKYWVLLPPPAPPTGVPKITPHAVGIPFVWLSATPYKAADTVQTSGSTTLQGGYDWYRIVHIPLTTAAPGPGEAVEFIKITALAGSKAQMSVHSVTAEKGAVATCIAAFVGLNVNCNEPADMPTGPTFVSNTVRTSPTAGDYAGAGAGYALDAALNFGFGKALTHKRVKDIAEVILKHIFRRAPDAPLIPNFPDKLQELVQKWVDGSPG
jgi:hypothetical protein